MIDARRIEHSAGTALRLVFGPFRKGELIHSISFGLIDEGGIDSAVPVSITIHRQRPSDDNASHAAGTVVTRGGSTSPGSIEVPAGSGGSVGSASFRVGRRVRAATEYIGVVIDPGGSTTGDIDGYVSVATLDE